MNKFTLKVWLIIGLTALFSSSAFAVDQRFVVRSLSNQFSFQEKKSLKVQTLMCEATCIPVDANVTPEFDLLKVDRISIGTYRLSKGLDLPIYTKVDLTVSFTTTVAGEMFQDEKNVSIRKLEPQPVTQVTDKVTKPKKPKYFRTKRAFRAWKVKQSRYLRYKRQQRMAVRKIRRAKPAKTTVAQTNVNPTAPVVRTLPTPTLTPKSEAKKDNKSKDKAIVGVQLPKGGNGKGTTQGSDVEWFWQYITPLCVLAVLWSVAVFFNSIRESFRRPRWLALAHGCSYFVYLGFFLSPVHLSDASVAWYVICFALSLAMSFVLLVKGTLRLGVQYKILHNNVCSESRMLRIWEESLYVRYFSKFDTIFNLLKNDLTHHPKAIVSHLSIRHKWKKAGAVGTGIVVIIAISSAIILGQDLKKPAPNIIPIIPITRTYEAKQTALSQNGMIAVYEIRYSQKLFDKSNSFDVRDGFAKRPLDGDFQFNRKLWLIGELAIDLARKHNLRLFTSTEETIEIWCPRNLSKTEFTAIVDSLNALFQDAFSINLEAVGKPITAIATKGVRRW